MSFAQLLDALLNFAAPALFLAPVLLGLPRAHDEVPAPGGSGS